MITYRISNNISDLAIAYTLANSLPINYPDFIRWYKDKVIPDILGGSGNVIIAEQNGDPAGFVISKNSETEKKIRCLRVIPKYQKRGIGDALINGVLNTLDCDKPVVTVSEGMMNLYASMFVNRYNFDLTEVLRGPYIPGQLEYIFNK